MNNFPLIQNKCLLTFNHNKAEPIDFEGFSFGTKILTIKDLLCV